MENINYFCVYRHLKIAFEMQACNLPLSLGSPKISYLFLINFKNISTQYLFNNWDYSKMLDYITYIISLKNPHVITWFSFNFYDLLKKSKPKTFIINTIIKTLKPFLMNIHEGIFKCFLISVKLSYTLKLPCKNI